MSARRARRLNYLLRPAKQVERKLIVRGLHQLRLGGFDIDRYRYIGFGSIYYADFLLLHRFLYIDDMVCVESGPFPRTMQFNLPYDFIRLDLRPVDRLIAELDANRQHLVWLDYDYAMNDSTLQDMAGFSFSLAPGSIILVTLNASSPSIVEEESREAFQVRRESIAAKLNNELTALSPGLKGKDLSNARFPDLVAQLATEHLVRNAARRSDAVRYLPLFSFRYSDNAQMVTIGGLLDEPGAAARLAACGFTSWEFSRTTITDPPVNITVPTLTSRERSWLDRHIRDGLPVEKVIFDLETDELAAFRSFYREYPSYFESIY